MIGIVDWRLAECARLGVDIRFTRSPTPTTCSRSTRTWSSSPPAACPSTRSSRRGRSGLLQLGHALRRRRCRPSEVLLFDDNGAHPGLTAAELIARRAARLEIVTPERFFAVEIGGLNHVPYASAPGPSRRADHHQPARARRPDRYGNGPVAAVVLGSEYTHREERRSSTRSSSTTARCLWRSSTSRSARRFEQPGRGRSRRAARRSAAGRGPQSERAISSCSASATPSSGRNIHAAIYDALRLVKDL